MILNPGSRRYFIRFVLNSTHFGISAKITSDHQLPGGGGGPPFALFPDAFCGSALLITCVTVMQLISMRLCHRITVLSTHFLQKLTMC
jgi:hypothetical protein